MYRNDQDYSDLPSCSYQQQPATSQQQFPQPSPGDSSCSGQLGNQSLQSPILPGGQAIGGSLNPLQPRFGGYGGGSVGGRSNLPYDFSNGPAQAGQFMGASKSQKGGRRPREIDMGEIDDPDEMEKKLKRRQRNKEAAARCRQRRLDLMGNLQEQVDRCKNDNLRKEMEINNIRNKLERLIHFLKNHECKMSEEDRASLQSIITSNVPLGHGNTNNYNNNASLPSTASSLANDYQPRQHNPPPHQNLKRPATSHATTTASDMNLFEPKVLKREDFDPTLADVNNAIDGNDAGVSRPDHLPMGLSLSESIPLSTPSNFPFNSQPNTFNVPNSYGSGFQQLFGDGQQPNILMNGSTGLTPSGIPTNLAFVTSTPTPLQNDEQNLRHL